MAGRTGAVAALTKTKTHRSAPLRDRRSSLGRHAAEPLRRELNLPLRSTTPQVLNGIRAQAHGLSGGSPLGGPASGPLPGTALGPPPGPASGPLPLSSRPEPSASSMAESRSDVSSSLR